MGEGQGKGRGPGQATLLGVNLADKDPKWVKARGKDLSWGRGPRGIKTLGSLRHFGIPGSCLVHKGRPREGQLKDATDRQTDMDGYLRSSSLQTNRK
jgi:hypothetical protein